MPDESREREYREEAERLAMLPREDQRRVIAQQKAIAADRKVPAPDRAFARERAAALERHLRRLNRQKKS